MTFNLDRAVRPAAVCWGAARAALGLVALADPPRAIRPWTGPDGADTVPARVLGRALGARDVVLGGGAIAAALRGRDLAAWAAAGAAADLGDTLTTAREWRRLPPAGRVLVTALAGGSVLAGAALAVLDARGRCPRAADGYRR
jgi:hypothetical protein